jgi:hypothetical protein
LRNKYYILAICILATLLSLGFWWAFDHPPADLNQDLAASSFPQTELSLNRDTHTGAEQFVSTADNAVISIRKPVHQLPTLQLVGRTVSAEGALLLGVSVLPPGRTGHPVLSDEEGNFSINIIVTDSHDHYYLRFRYEGYHEVSLALRKEQLDARSLNLGDVVLQAEGPVASLDGSVRDDGGMPVAGATVRLFSNSLNKRFEAQSNEDGNFFFPRVYSAGDYRLRVQAPGPYVDFTQTMLDIPVGHTFVEYTLARSVVGGFDGRMVDTQGQGVSYRNLQLESDDAQSVALTVTGDADGYFRIVDIPLGVYALRSRASPYLDVGGIEINNNMTDLVEVVLDVGDGLVEGSVVDQYGEPVHGARVRIDWVEVHRGFRSRSRRLVLTDHAGYFGFVELGPGKRQMIVQASDFQTAELAFSENDTWIEVQLKRAVQ